MSEKVDILVTDFQQIRSNSSSTTNDRASNGFTITIGDYDRMMKFDPTVDNVYGNTCAIATNYCRGRFYHIIALSLYNKNQNFIDLDLINFNEIMDRIDDIYMTEQIPVLFVNIMARQIYLNTKNQSESIDNPSLIPLERERYGQEAADLLKKYGYIDIGSDYRGEFSIPKYVSIKANDIGSAMISNNFKSFW